MAQENHEKIFSILMEIKHETGAQTEKLIALNDKVAIANGRTGKNEAEIANIREWAKYVLGCLFIIGVVGLYAATMYIKDVATKAAQIAISNINNPKP